MPTTHPFAVDYSIIAADFSSYIDGVFSSLSSSFLTLPKGNGFVEYADFQRA